MAIFIFLTQIKNNFLEILPLEFMNVTAERIARVYFNAMHAHIFTLVRVHFKIFAIAFTDVYATKKIEKIAFFFRNAAKKSSVIIFPMFMIFVVKFTNKQ